MPVLELMSKGETGTMYRFYCPGCDCSHFVRTEGPTQPVWQWNHDVDKPTVTPSIMVMKDSPEQCHLFIKDGQIIYLDDCHHSLKGQTVELLDTNQN